MAMEDLPTPVQSHVFIRGNPGNVGDAVPRQFLAILSPGERQPFHDGSGRLELARKIASPDNPLTARVIVNRVWLDHFGYGIVRTPSDYGTRGERPTHPELLDYMALRFMEEGWSLKKLNRLIMLSAVYQQKSDDRPDCRAVDPENLLLWRVNRRRLDFEAMRDSILAVSGQLDRTMYGRAVDITVMPPAKRRTIYGFIDRQNLPNLFRSFDFASPDTHSPQRYSTTVPQQALFMLNSPFAMEMAKQLVARVDASGASEPATKVTRLYQDVFARSATAEEISLAMEFVKAESAQAPGTMSPWEKLAQVLLASNEFMFVD